MVLSSFSDYYRTRTTSKGIKQVVQKELAIKELIMTVEGWYSTLLFIFKFNFYFRNYVQRAKNQL